MVTAAIGGMATALTIWLIWRKAAPRLAVWMALIAGLTIGAGLLGGVATRVGAALVNAGSSGTALLFGVAVPAAIGMIVLLELVSAMRKKGKVKPHRIAHPILAFMAPALLVAAGGIFAVIVGWMDQGVDVLPAVVSSFTGR